MMNKLSTYIIEKLKINRLSKNSNDVYNFDYERCFGGEVDDYDKMQKGYYNDRKSNRKLDGNTLKNKNWYAVVILLKTCGPLRKEKIKELLWPGQTGQKAEFFTAMRYDNILYTVKEGEFKGCYDLRPYNVWRHKNKYGK